MNCCFIGHKYIPSETVHRLEAVIIDLIENHACYTFYVGNNGTFDVMVTKTLQKLQTIYSDIKYYIVLAYMPTGHSAINSYINEHETIYPCGLETVPLRFAIPWRNKWMVQNSDILVAYIEHSQGNSYKLAKYAKNKKKQIINLGRISI